MNFKNNLLYGLGLSLVLLFISSLASYISIRSLIESSSMVRDSNQTIKDLDRIFSLVKDAETGQRGYLLTRDDRFLQPYTNAKDKIADAMNQLSIEVSKTNTQSKNLEKLKFNVENRLQILEENLNHKKENRNVTTEQLLGGKKYMDAIRNKVAIMQAEEQAILQNRTESMERFASFTPWLIVVSALLAITITLVFYR
ncbi:MAG: CHASE3 domain-containing protein, partial [Kaistella sp.]